MRGNSTVMLPPQLDIAVVAPFPTAERVREGWMSRIASVDRILAGCQRVYLFFAEHHRVGIDDTVRQLDATGWEICLHPGEAVHQSLVTEIVERVRSVYVHTVHLADFIRPWLPSGKCIVDIHGITPEEEIMLGRPHLAPHYAEVERDVLVHARQAVVVTNAMAQHLAAKYPELTPRFLTLPIVEQYAPRPLPPIPPVDTWPLTVVYSGGIQVWQNLDAMLTLVERCADFSHCTFLSHAHAEIQARAARLTPRLMAHYGFCEKTRLPAAYAQHAFGLVLRDDTAVNRVSCPTKLSEYLTFGLIPIVRSPQLGDFAELGYWYITEEEFAEEFVPDAVTRGWMREANRAVMSQLQQRFTEAAATLRQLVVPAP